MVIFVCSQEKHVYHWKNEESEICGKSDFGSQEDCRITTKSHGRVPDNLQTLTLKTEEQGIDLWTEYSPAGLSPLHHNLHS